MNKKIFSFLSVMAMSIFFFLASTVNAADIQCKRLAGSDRYQTGSKIVSSGWTASNYAVLASGEGFADALCAAPLAQKYKAPILLTSKDTLDANTKNELTRLKVKKIFIIGGSGVISNNIESQIHNMNIEATRIYGQDRFETCLEVAKNLDVSNGVVVTNGYGFADALSIAPIAAQKGMPILLTESSDLPSSIKAFLSNKTYDKSFILGGSGVVSDKIASQLKNNKRLGGASRYETNAAVLNNFASELNYDNVYVASGENYPDALSGSALASSTNSPLILVGNSIDPSVMNSVKAQHDKYKNITLLGGSSVVTDILAKSIMNGKVTTNGNLKVHYINVGQADSILVQTPNGKNMLIDAGNNGDNKTIVSYLQNLGITKLDIIAGTHPHEDHIGAMDTIINMFQVGKVYMPKITSTTKTFEDVITSIKNKGLNITTPVPNTTVDLDSNVKLEILAPNGEKYEDLNNHSIVFKLTYGSKSFLFTGDAEDVSEKEMLSKGFNLKADVLKVGHHGSTSSTTSEFLNAVSPKYAVISVGKGNDYGHPAQSTMDKLKNAGIAVYRTDECGTVVATCDGTSITFNTNVGSYDGTSTTNTQPVVPKPSTQPTVPSTVVPKPAIIPTPKPVIVLPVVTPQSSTVYVTKSGKKYHKDGCSSLKKSKIPMNIEDAKSQGFTPCSNCNP